MFSKSNTLITILYDTKNNKTYKLDKTSKKIYYHTSRFGNLQTIGWIGFAFAMFVLPRVFFWIEELLSRRIPFEDTRMFSIISVVLLGLVCTLITWKRRDTPRINEYLAKYKDAKELHNVKEVLKRAYLRAALIVLITLGSLGISFYQFVLFFEASEFVNFRNGLMAYAVFSLIVVLFFDAIVVIRLYCNTRNIKR